MTKSAKGTVAALGLLLAILVGYWGCTQKASTGSPGVDYKLAVMVPETGNLAFIGQPMRNALILANEDNQIMLANSKIKIDLVFGDTQGNPSEAVTQLRRLVDSEKVNGIITTLSGVVAAISPLSKDSDILLIALTPDPSFLSMNSRGLRVLFSFDKEGMQLADLVKERGWKKVLILHSTDSATTYEVTKILEPKLRVNGVLTTMDTFNVGQRDFKDLCAKYSEEKWDGLILHGFGSELPFLGEAILAHPNLASVPKMSPLSTLDVKPELRRNLAGIEFFAPAFLAKASPEYGALNKRYAERFPGVPFTYSSVYAYDAYTLLAKAVLETKTTRADDLKRSLQSPTKALTQEYRFNEKGDFDPDTALMKIAADGSFVPVH